MRRLITGISGLAIIAGTAFVGPALMGAADAADGSGAYGAWSLDATTKTTGAITFTGTIFPNATVTSSGQNLSVATSQTLSATTPFGAAYGPSTGKTYLSVGLASGVARANVTITFDVPAIAGTYGLAMGDVDAENIILSAKDAQGNDVNVSEWNGTEFNYAGGTDLPKWDGATGTITGNGVDTAGASMWIVPNQTVKSITLTQTRTSGFPAYQLWIAADIITATPAPAPTPTATAIPAAPAGKVTICHRTASAQNPYVMMTIDQNAVTRRGHDTHTGGVFPAKPWGDIIPPFGTYPGLNWAAGAAILNSQCEVAGEEPIAAGLASASPSATASSSASASASSSASTSASASSSPSTSASASASVTPSASATASASPSASASSSSATPSATTPTTAAPTTAPSATTEPSNVPTPTETVPPTDRTPIVVSPDGPTVIPTNVIPDGAEVIGVIPPKGGTAEVTDGVVTYTPDPGTSGTTKVTVVVREKDGTIAAVPVTVKVGKPAKPCTTLPASLHFGTNVLPRGGAGCQPVTVRVTCSPLARTLHLGDLSFCTTSTVNGRTTVRIVAGQPLGVKVSITGKATSTRPAIADEQVFFVRR